MSRTATFLLLIAFPLAALSQGQRGRTSEIPPGPPYDPAKHVNPLITFVQSKDFKSSNYKEAQESADIQILGISKETGTLEGIALAQPPVDAQKELKLNVKANFYPVVRQIFKVEGGGEIALYSFKTPRVQDTNYFGRLSVGGMPPSRGRDIINQKRFGKVPLPEELEVRGEPGLLFEDDGTLTVAWQEEGVTYAATSKLSRKALFQVIDDLL
jgi:hypothetical protein